MNNNAVKQWFSHKHNLTIMTKYNKSSFPQLKIEYKC